MIQRYNAMVGIQEQGVLTIKLLMVNRAAGTCIRLNIFLETGAIPLITGIWTDLIGAEDVHMTDTATIVSFLRLLVVSCKQIFLMGNYFYSFVFI